MTLRDAAVGSTVVVSKITGDPAYKRRIMDMGITKEASFTSEKLLLLEIRLRSPSEVMSFPCVSMTQHVWK